MKPWFVVAALAVMVASLSPPLYAQWPLYPMPEVPKGPEGKPDLTAPAPRTADGKPDLSGIWMRYEDPEPNGTPPDRPPLVKGGDAGAGFKNGLPFQPWAAELQKKRAAEGGLNDPDGLCLPQGPLQYHIDPQPFKIVQTPRQVFYASALARNDPTLLAKSDPPPRRFGVTSATGKDLFLPAGKSRPRQAAAPRHVTVSSAQAIRSRN